MPTRPDHHRQAALVAMARLGALAALNFGVLAGACEP
jgi:hypothetical protein